MRQLIPTDAWEELKDRKEKLFNIDEVELDKVLREVYQKIIPELADRIKMPFHLRNIYYVRVIGITDLWLVLEIGTRRP